MPSGLQHVSRPALGGLDRVFPAPGGPAYCVRGHVVGAREGT